MMHVVKISVRKELTKSAAKNIERDAVEVSASSNRTSKRAHFCLAWATIDGRNGLIG